MWELAAIGLIGGVVTGISPCILPVLPVVLAVATGERARPLRVVAGIATSFSVITLLGTVALNALGLPQATVRWVGIGLLVLVGLSMLIPPLGRIVEKPFEHLPRPTFLQTKARGRGGFIVGLALGAVYVPCAGPVLAAVTVAGATGEIGWSTVVLTVAFAIGASAPLLVFALAGNKIGQRIDVAQKNRTLMRGIAGAVVLLLAVALAVDAPAKLQRALPDWTAGVQRSLGDNERVQDALDDVRGGGAETTTSAPVVGSGDLDSCRTAEPDQLQDCGMVPELTGLTGWFNTDEPVDPRKPKVANGLQTITLVDFWAYACINCQRANQHLTALYDAYRDHGLVVVGVHAPEYGFEHEAANVQAAAREQNIHYPVAQDNSFTTWRNFNNRYWPAHYLVDHKGVVRQIHEGEGAYAETEQLVRELLQQANPGIQLPEPVESNVQKSHANAAVVMHRNPETYLGTGRAQYYTNTDYDTGERTFDAPKTEPPRNFYHLTGTWNLQEDSVAPVRDASLTLNFRAAVVQLVASGTGELKVSYPDGSTKSVPVPEVPGSIDLIRGNEAHEGILTISAPEGVQLYSMTFG